MAALAVTAVASAEVRDRYRLLRGRGHLDRALAALDRLRAARLPAPPRLNFAMSRHNRAETPALLETGRHPFAYAAETGNLLVGARLRAPALRGGAG